MLVAGLDGIERGLDPDDDAARAAPAHSTPHWARSRRDAVLSELLGAQLLEAMVAGQAPRARALRPHRDRLGVARVRHTRLMPQGDPMLKGYSLPLSPGGRSSLVAEPAVALRRRSPGDRVLGRPGRRPRSPPAGPRAAPHRTRAGRLRSSPTGRAAPTAAPSCSTLRAASTWSSSSSSTRCWNGKEVTTCPYIWVDRDFALMRGWFQGFPKKQGSVWMTRHFGLQNGAEPGLPSGSTFGGTLAANDRRLGTGHGHAREHRRDRADPQRPAARQRAPLPAPQCGQTRPAGRPRLAGSLSRDRSTSEIWEGSGDARAPARRRRRRRRWPRCAWARATAPRSPTPSTTRPTRALWRKDG